MIYKLGKVITKAKTYILFESNGTGYIINVANVEPFEIDKFQKVFIYEHLNEYVHTFYGFKHFKERILFEDLLTIQGIGPKTAITILNHDWKNIIQIIASGDYEELAKLPYIGTRIARQVVFELQNKYKTIINKKPESKNKIEVIKTLKELGFNDNQINLVSNKLEENENIDLMIEKAIEMISNEYQNTNITKA